MLRKGFFLRRFLKIERRTGSSIPGSSNAHRKTSVERVVSDFVFEQGLDDTGFADAGKADDSQRVAGAFEAVADAVDALCKVQPFLSLSWQNDCDALIADQVVRHAGRSVCPAREGPPTE